MRPRILGKAGPHRTTDWKNRKPRSRMTGRASSDNGAPRSARKIIHSVETIHAARDALFQGRLAIIRPDKARRPHFSGLLPALFMAGCAVGPDFKKPAAPEVGDYTTAPLSATAGTQDVTGGDAQRFLKGSDISGEWWTLFQSKAIDELVQLVA